MSKFKSTIILVAVFLGLLAFVYFFEKDKDSKEEVEANKDQKQEQQVFDFAPADVNKLTIKNEEGTFTLEKKNEGWKLQEDEGLDVNQLQVDKLIESIEGYQTLDKFELTELKDFGLDEPRVTAEVNFTYEGSQKIAMGDATIAGSHVYARKNEDNEVFTVDLATFTKFKEITKDSFKKEVADDQESPEENEE